MSDFEHKTFLEDPQNLARETFIRPIDEFAAILLG
jgi:hypothetical protein